jgi:23S rRNA pseudouridine2605 synthase
MKKSADAPIRLQKYLADAGIASRRAAEMLIADGKVRVNGKVAELGCKITPGVDQVKASGKLVRPQTTGTVTLAVNKPRGLACTNSDRHNPRTVFDLVPPPYNRLRLFCAGRLDKESEGLVILTTDGQLANRLMHPSGLVVKYYRVSLKTPFPHAKLDTLVRGIVIEGDRLKVEKAKLLGPGKSVQSTEVDVEMNHGKKREIRELFTKLGYDVKRLRRYQIGRFSLRGFPLRAVKLLTDSEIKQLLSVPQR